MAKSKKNAKSSTRSAFALAAKRRGISVQDFVNKILANPSNYPSNIVNKAEKVKPKFALGGGVFNSAVPSKYGNDVSGNLGIETQLQPNVGQSQQLGNVQNQIANTTDKANGQTAINQATDSSGTNDIMGLVGQTGGVGGAIAGIDSVIGSVVDPMMEDSLSTNQYGEFDDKNEAQASMIGQSFFDPLSTGMAALEDDGASTLEKVGSFMGFGAAFSGDKADRMEKAAMEESRRVRQREAVSEKLAGLEKGPTYNDSSTFAYGGEVGDKKFPSGQVVQTPRYANITPRTYYLENKRKGNLPNNLKYSDFVKNQESHLPKEDRTGYSDYKYDSKTKQYSKNFPQVQESAENIAAFDELGTMKHLPKGQKVHSGKIKYADGGQTGGSNVDVATDYLKNLRMLENKLANNMLKNENVPTDSKRQAVRAYKGISNEVPSNMNELLDPANQDEMKYMNSLASRAEGMLTTDNIETATGSNNPLNIYKKVNLLQDSQLYKADFDSIQKYMPQFYEDGNLKYGKMLANEGEIKYAIGGEVIPTDIEVEGGESIQEPNGDNYNVQGPSHANGGVDLEVESGTRIYSDRLKVPGTKKTFSDANKKLSSEINKYQETLESSYSTPTAKRTAKKMLSKLEGEQDSLFQSQQSLNGDSKGKKFAEGGSVGDYMAYAPAAYNILSGMFGNADTQQAQDTTNYAGQRAVADMRSQRYDIAPQQTAIRRAANVGRRDVASAARSRGELLGGYGNISAQRGAQEANLLSQKQNIETGYRNQASQLAANLGESGIQRNMAENQRVYDYNARAEAAKQNLTQTGLSQTSGIYQQQRHDNEIGDNQAQQNATMEQLLAQMFPNMYGSNGIYNK